jgi:hypothetical protein
MPAVPSYYSRQGAIKMAHTESASDILALFFALVNRIKKETKTATVPEFRNAFSRTLSKADMFFRKKSKCLNFYSFRRGKTQSTRSVGNYDMPPPIAQQHRPRRGMNQSFRRVPYRLRW